MLVPIRRSWDLNDFLTDHTTIVFVCAVCTPSVFYDVYRQTMTTTPGPYCIAAKQRPSSDAGAVRYRVIRLRYRR